MKRAWIGVGIIAALLAGVIIFFLLALHHGEGDLEAQIGQGLGYWTVLPFVAILLCIAILPLVKEHWWESNLNKGIVAIICGLPIFLYFLVTVDLGPSAVVAIFHEYYSFIILLAALLGGPGELAQYLASNRTAEGARHSLNRGLQVAFRAGAALEIVLRINVVT